MRGFLSFIFSLFLSEERIREEERAKRIAVAMGVVWEREATGGARQKFLSEIDGNMKVKFQC